ncbi:MAG: dephospho-CoA kinase [Prevotella sp.]|nr:dephospho-CoA kinase [Prevotella sp.]
MKHIALTGGIGSGKSFVCRQLARRGIWVYNCDIAAGWLIRESPPIRQALADLVGSQLYADGEFHKEVLSEFILSSDAAKKAVNEIVHPAVAQDFLDSGLEWLESAILFESNFHQRLHFDHIVCVTAPLDLRLRRIIGRDGLTSEKALEWIRCQMPQEKILKRSHFEIVNDEAADLDAQIDTLLATINNPTPNN